MFTSFAKPVDKALMRRQRIATTTSRPLYRSKFNKSNNYGYDAREQATRTYTGMGEDINVHDQFAVESLGPIQNRMREHLGQSDRGIVAYRRLLTSAIAEVEKGLKPPMTFDDTTARAMTGPATVDGVAPKESWQSYWRDAYQRARRAAPWEQASD